MYKVCVVIRKLGHFLLELGLNKKKREREASPSCLYKPLVSRKKRREEAA
jgi:hypothetical protein